MRNLVIALILVSCGHTQHIELSQHGTGYATACNASFFIDRWRLEDNRFITIDDHHDESGCVAVFAENGIEIARTSQEQGFVHGRGGGRLTNNPRAVVVVRLDDQNRRVCTERLSFE